MAEVLSDSGANDYAEEQALIPLMGADTTKTAPPKTPPRDVRVSISSEELINRKPNMGQETVLPPRVTDPNSVRELNETSGPTQVSKYQACQSLYHSTRSLNKLIKFDLGSKKRKAQDITVPIPLDKYLGVPFSFGVKPNPEIKQTNFSAVKTSGSLKGQSSTKSKRKPKKLKKSEEDGNLQAGKIGNTLVNLIDTKITYVPNFGKAEEAVGLIMPPPKP